MDSPRELLPLAPRALLFAMDALRAHVHEHSTNWGPEIEQYLEEAGIDVPAPWCCAFVNWCAKQAADLTGEHSPLEDIPLEAYVQAYYNYGKEHGWIVPPKDVGTGDLFLLYHQSLGRYAHIGFVLEVREDEGWFETCEGNSNLDGSREGYEVVSKLRDLTNNVVFLRWA